MSHVILVGYGMEKEELELKKDFFIERGFKVDIKNGQTETIGNLFDWLIILWPFVIDKSTEEQIIRIKHWIWLNKRVCIICETKPIGIPSGVEYYPCWNNFKIRNFIA